MDDGGFSETGSTEWEKVWGEGDKEINFSQDKCEVSFLGLGFSQSFRAEKVKTKGHFKTSNQKHS